MNKNPLSENIYYRRTKPSLEKDYRGEYFRDQTKIIHSLPFRRLKHKTQVFFDPDNDHICTRMEHVLHVATIAATICRGLNSTKNWNLDQDMAYAIGLGHDLGHAPFGHAGEDAIKTCIKDDFAHEINSYRVAEHLANYGAGMNLTFAVKDGIMNHCGEDFLTRHLRPAPAQNDLENPPKKGSFPNTYEGCVVRLSDKIAYMGRDIEDAIKAGFITKSDIPSVIKQEMGASNGEIINTFVMDVIEHCGDKDYIAFSDEKFELAGELGEFNYKNIYKNPFMQSQNEVIFNCITTIFDFFTNIFGKYDFDYKKYAVSDKRSVRSFGKYLESMKSVYREETAMGKTAIIDYIAGMSDSYALQMMEDIMLPTPIKFK